MIDFWRSRVWLLLKMHGLGPLRQVSEEKSMHTKCATDVLPINVNIESLVEPEVWIVAFRLAATGRDPPALNHVNQLLLECICTLKNVPLNEPPFSDRLAIRIYILSFRTHQERVRTSLDNIRAAGNAIAAGSAQRLA